jgi:hypothetical protein
LWAAGYNLISIPLAADVLASGGFVRLGSGSFR